MQILSCNHSCIISRREKFRNSNMPFFRENKPEMQKASKFKREKKFYLFSFDRKSCRVVLQSCGKVAVKYVECGGWPDRLRMLPEVMTTECHAAAICLKIRKVLKEMDANTYGTEEQ